MILSNRIVPLAITVGTAYALAAAFALQLLHPEIDPVRLTVSQYATGPHGFLLTIAFLVSGINLFALLIGIWAAPWRRSRLEPALLAVAAICACLVSIFPADIYRPGAHLSAAGLLHRALAGLAFACLTLVALRTSRQIWVTEKRRTLKRLIRASAVGLALAIAIDIAVLALGLPIGGLGERIVILFAALWLLLMAFYLSGDLPLRSENPQRTD
ncbi:MAG: DUF998 domain-containing protein [Rudaea sp.]